jgi:hypothetical protein
VAPGVAAGGAAGFSIQKTGVDRWDIGTLRSGFNTQFPVAGNPRPGYAAGTADELRTMPEALAQTILPLLESALTGGGQLPGRGRAGSV